MCYTVECLTVQYSEVCTVEPRLSESPLYELSVIWMLFWILKSKKMPWFSAKPSNKWNAYMILDLLGLLYHGTVGRRAY